MRSQGRLPGGSRLGVGIRTCAAKDSEQASACRACCPARAHSTGGDEASKHAIWLTATSSSSNLAHLYMSRQVMHCSAPLRGHDSEMATPGARRVTHVRGGPGEPVEECRCGQQRPEGEQAIRDGNRRGRSRTEADDDTLITDEDLRSVAGGVTFGRAAVSCSRPGSTSPQ